MHRAGFVGSNQRLRGDFAAIITAEDVGSYKPAENHFRALDTTLLKLGVDRAELLYVAQSLFHDHVAAKREGLPSVWINRRHDRPGWGATPEPTADFTYNLQFASMGDFADAVDRAFAETAGLTKKSGRTRTDGLYASGYADLPMATVRTRNAPHLIRAREPFPGRFPSSMDFQTNCASW